MPILVRPAAAPDGPPSWWSKLTAAQRATIAARLRTVRKTDKTVPDPATWPK